MQITDNKEKTEPRSREKTERRIVEAARHLLAVHGFQEFGVNAIARAAGCDKQLIYKYFGGLDGVADLIGDDVAAWVASAIRVRPGPPPPDFASAAETMVIDYLEALRRNRLAQQIMAWEVTEKSLLVRRLGEARTAAIRDWSTRVLTIVSRPHSAIDIAMVGMLLVAAIEHTVLTSRVSGKSAGLQLVVESDWYRVEKSLRHMVRTALAAPHQDADWEAGISITSPS